MTISELTKILIDFIDDGYGNAPIYFDDKEIKSVVTEDVLPPCDGTFEPYQNIKLSDTDEEQPDAIYEADNTIARIMGTVEGLNCDDSKNYLKDIKEAVDNALLQLNKQ